MTTNRKSTAAGIVGVLVLLGVLAFIGWALWQAYHPAPVPLQGQVEARTINIAPKISARIATLSVREGQAAAAGAQLVTLDSPEVRAKLAQASAVQAAADAKRDLVDVGARPEDIRAAKANWDKATASVELADKTYQRLDTLYKEGLVSLQRNDEAQTNYKAAVETALAAKAQYDTALIGSRPQEKRAAGAAVLQAAGGVAEVDAAALELVLKAPLAAEVDKVVLHPGELAAAGFPILTLVNLADIWVVFNLREDDFAGIKIGGVLHIPAHWERDRLRNAPQPVVLYSNAQISLVAGIIGGDVRAAVTSMGVDRAVASEARFGDGLAQAAVRLSGVQADLRTLFNPSLSYEAYFAGMPMPVALHLFCVIAAVSTLGREFRNRSVDAWLQSAGGSLPRALLGKFAPVAAVYLLFALAIVALFAGWRGWTVAGSLVLWMVAIAVLMLVSIALAVLLVGATVNLRTALSVTGFYVATGLAFSGFSYPRAAMGEAAQWWGGLLPYTHYLPVQQGQWLGGASASAWAQGMEPLLWFIALPLLVGLPLLGRAVRNPARWGGR